MTTYRANLITEANADRAFVVGHVDIYVADNNLGAAVAEGFLTGYRRGAEELETALASEPVRIEVAVGREVTARGMRGIVTEAFASSGMVSVMWIGGAYPVREDPADLELVETPAKPVMTAEALDGIGGTYAIYRDGLRVATAELIARGYDVTAWRYGDADPDGCSSTRRMSLADAVEWAATLAPRSGK